MHAFAWLLVSALSAPFPARAQDAPSAADPVRACRRRLAALKDDAVFKEKILPVWLKDKFQRPPEDAEEVWSKQCESGPGDGRTPSADWVEKDARDVYYADREGLSRRVLGCEELEKIPTDDLNAFMDLGPDDFRDADLSSQVLGRQTQIRKMGDAALANFEGASLASRNAGGGSVSPAGDVHPGEIVHVDKVDGRVWRRSASEVPQTIAWAQLGGKWVPVVRIVITGTNRQRRMDYFGPDQQFLRSDIQAPGP